MTSDRDAALARGTRQAETWNVLVPVGTPVDYYPIAGEPEHIRTETRSGAWTLAHGEAVVLVKGQTGGVLLSHCQPVPSRD